MKSHTMGAIHNRHPLAVEWPRKRKGPTMDHTFEPAKLARTDADAHAIQQDPLLADRPRGSRSNALLGREFVERKRRPIAAIVFGVWALLGSTQFFLEFLDGWQFLAAISSIPAALAATWCFFYRPVARVRFTEEGVEISRPYESLAYSEIMEVYAPDRLVMPDAFDIYLLHAYGTARIPKTIRADFVAIYDFLVSQPLAARDHSIVPHQLQYSLEVALYEHGSDKVFVYRSRLRLEKPDAPRRGEQITAWMFYGGFGAAMAIVMIGMALGNQNGDIPGLLMIPFTLIGVCMIFGAFGYLAFMLYRALAEFYYSFEKTSFLIVSPLGIAAMSSLTPQPATTIPSIIELLATRGNERLIVASWNDLRDGGAAGLTISGISSIRIWNKKTSIRFRDDLNWPIRHAIEQIRKQQPA